jgi:hypothetical protein
VDCVRFQLAAHFGGTGGGGGPGKLWLQPGHRLSPFCLPSWYVVHHWSPRGPGGWPLTGENGQLHQGSAQLSYSMQFPTGAGPWLIKAQLAFA